MPTPYVSQAKQATLAPTPTGIPAAPPPAAIQGPGNDQMAQWLRAFAPDPTTAAANLQFKRDVLIGRHLGMGGGTEGNAAGPTGGDPFSNGFFKPEAQRQGLQTTMPSPETLAAAFAHPATTINPRVVAHPATSVNTGVPNFPGLFPAGPQTQEAMTPFGPIQSNPGPLAPNPLVNSWPAAGPVRIPGSHFAQPPMARSL